MKSRAPRGLSAGGNSQDDPNACVLAWAPSARRRRSGRVLGDAGGAGNASSGSQAALQVYPRGKIGLIVDLQPSDLSHHHQVTEDGHQRICGDKDQGAAE